MSTTEEAQAFIAMFVDSGKTMKEVIPILHKGSFDREFGKDIPQKDSYEKWKTENNVIPISNFNKDGDPMSGEPVYKMSDGFREMIYDFLNTRPMLDEMGKTKEGKKIILETYIHNVFEAEGEGSEYVTRDGIEVLIDYLKHKCPRKEAKPLLEALMNGGIAEYFVQKNEDTDKTET